ncbi:hypothetical protein P8C59_004184 [Phyllachora maydis]|uniref:Uncharacterized protein n=1 Tax=Phyllachora maydis TaxID=1825666 RepID=A0AAD9I2X1_9PEZI|nr:hypothetical protein P8C59_004184 [Phyllachora maydis]
MATRIFQVLILLIACLLVPCLGSALGTTSLGWNTSTTATPISPASTESPAPAPVPFSNMTNCTWGPPADSGSQPGSYPIAYQLVQPDTTSPPFSASNGSYKVQDAWYRAHWVDGPRTLGTTIPGYGPFKCQFWCNSQSTCSSFFAYYDYSALASFVFACVLFDTILDPTLFVPSNGTSPAGGYDRLCYNVNQ